MRFTIYNVHRLFWGNTVREYTIGVVVFFSVFVLLPLIKAIVISQIKKVPALSKGNWEDKIEKSLKLFNAPFYFTVAVYALVQTIQVSDFIDRIVSIATLAVVVIYVAFFIQKLVLYSISFIVEKERAGVVSIDRTIGNFLNTLIRSIIWIAAAVIILENIGFNVSALLGGLGIAGLAVAFAFQNILRDIFAFFSIYFDKPFEKGDFIEIGEDKGTVEHIGIRSTKLRTIQGQELIISNQELTSSRINNFKRMEKRRVVFKLGVSYKTSNAKLKKALKIIKECIKNRKQAEFERVHFTEFGDYALIIEGAYTVLSKNYLVYKRVKQSINFAIKEAFEKEKIEFAYPTQELLLRQISNVSS